MQKVQLTEMYDADTAEVMLHLYLSAGAPCTARDAA